MSDKPISNEPSWTDADLADPHADERKAEKVRAMFAAIAGRYDLNNHLHSLWRDQAWRRYVVRSAGVKPGERVLDVACGTGDLTEAFARSKADTVVGMDFTEAMLDVARTKQARLRKNLAGKITYLHGDAMGLPCEDETFDVVSIAFGIRNVTDPGRAVAEFARVLRPGGRLMILEFDRLKFAPLRLFNDFYCGWLMPRTSAMIAGDRCGAYRYLPASVKTFLSREELCELIRASGFDGITVKGLTLGICACYRAEKVGRERA